MAVYAGEGTNLKSKFPVLLRNHLPYHQDISGFGIIADADEKEPRAVVQEYHKAFEVLFPDFPLKPGVADSDSLRTGIFVLPNKRDRGVLETQISECGAMIYPRFMMLAKNFVAQFDEEDTSHWKPFDRDKAIIAAAASILQPGKTNTVTIKKDQWIQKETFSVISDIVAFLKDLLKLR